MGPIEILMEEHRRIEEALDALTGYVSGLCGGASVEREDLSRFVEFIRRFADSVHHGKEEDILFRSLTEHGMPVDQGPLGVMLHEHDLGREFVGRLAEVAVGEGALDPGERERVAEAGGGYVRLLRDHIMKEDRILYPMSEKLLPADEWVRIAAEFADHSTAHAEENARLREIGAELAAKYGTARP